MFSYQWEWSSICCHIWIINKIRWFIPSIIKGELTFPGGCTIWEETDEVNKHATERIKYEKKFKFLNDLSMNIRNGAHYWSKLFYPWCYEHCMDHSSVYIYSIKTCFRNITFCSGNLWSIFKVSSIWVYADITDVEALQSAEMEK
jgi:hypothetical protein